MDGSNGTHKVSGALVGCFERDTKPALVRAMKSNSKRYTPKQIHIGSKMDHHAPGSCLPVTSGATGLFSARQKYDTQSIRW